MRKLLVDFGSRFECRLLVKMRIGREGCRRPKQKAVLCLCVVVGQFEKLTHYQYRV